MDILKGIIQIIFIGAIIFALAYSMNIGLQRGEEQECNKWMLEAQQYGSSWYSASWQKMQCSNYGIKLPR